MKCLFTFFLPFCFLSVSELDFKWKHLSQPEGFFLCLCQAGTITGLQKHIGQLAAAAKQKTVESW